MELIRCSKCEVPKTPEDFSPDSRRRTGRASMCKSCRAELQRLRYHEDPSADKKKSHEWKRANPEKSREHNREYYLRNAEECKALRRERREQYPERLLAQNELARAIRKGKVIRPDECEECGRHKDVCGLLDGHHGDYSKALDVEWLCRSCHNLLHRRMNKTVILQH